MDYHMTAGETAKKVNPYKEEKMERKERI